MPFLVPFLVYFYRSRLTVSFVRVNEKSFSSECLKFVYMHDSFLRKKMLF